MSKQEHLIPIGTMARINRITIPTLRYYDRIGLLKPKRTDPDTGYRYYSLEQNARLDIISYMKEMGMSISEISEILQKEDLNLIEEILSRHMFAAEQNRSLKAYIARNPLQSITVLAIALLSVIGFQLYLMWIRQRASKEAYDIAHHNLQTGLPNVRWFEEKAPRLIKKHEKDRKEGRLFVLVLSTQRIDL